MVFRFLFTLITSFLSPTFKYHSGEIQQSFSQEVIKPGSVTSFEKDGKSFLCSGLGACSEASCVRNVYLKMYLMDSGLEHISVLENVLTGGKRPLAGVK